VGQYGPNAKVRALTRGVRKDVGRRRHTKRGLALRNYSKNRTAGHRSREGAHIASGGILEEIRHPREREKMKLYVKAQFPSLPRNEKGISPSQSTYGSQGGRVPERVLRIILPGNSINAVSLRKQKKG